MTLELESGPLWRSADSLMDAAWRAAETEEDQNRYRCAEALRLELRACLLDIGDAIRTK